MLLDAFQIRYPEFRTAGDALVQACLDEATLELDAGQWGTNLDTAQGLKAAHKIATSPGGQMSRLVQKDGSTCYSKAFATLQRAVCMTVLVT